MDKFKNYKSLEAWTNKIELEVDESKIASCNTLSPADLAKMSSEESYHPMPTHPEHICRFNDGESTCECYDAGFEAGKKEIVIFMRDCFIERGKDRGKDTIIWDAKQITEVMNNILKILNK